LDLQDSACRAPCRRAEPDIVGYGLSFYKKGLSFAAYIAIAEALLIAGLVLL
jgi:hypothetical protein